MRFKTNLVICIILSINLFVTKSIAQSKKQHEYYIEIKNVNTKAIAKQVEALVKSQPNVNFFTGYKMPVIFYVLISTTEINKTTFSNWIKPLGLEVNIFEKKEITAAFIQAKKRKKSNTGKEDKPTETK